MAVVVALSAALIIYNSTVQLVPGFGALYVPINVAATVVLAMVSRRLGMRSSDLGLDPTKRREGLAVGGTVALAALVLLAIGAALPPLHPLFHDARITGEGWGLILYRALVRIPLGTALVEEFAFRGVLYGIWSRVHGRRHALVGSSIVFGLWHIRPAVDLLDANGLAVTAMARTAVLAGAVVAAAAAGLFLGMLRARTSSLWAPLAAHASINSIALVVAAMVS